MLTCRSYRYAIIYYLSIIILLFSAFSVDVIAPDLQKLEIGLSEHTHTGAAAHLENEKFTDHPIDFIPEVSEHLTATRSGWLALWTNKTELGRPLYQIYGFSGAYLPSWLLTKITHSPWQFMTILSLSTCFLAGLFILLFAREIGLNPLAGLIAGTSLAASPFFMYWLTFPMFPAAVCWSAGALWAVTRIARRSDLIGWSALAFSGYSLLMTAYPQLIIFHAYLLGGYGLWLARNQYRIGRAALFRFLALSLSALALGAACAFPVYHDLAIAASESLRVSPDPSFLTALLPNFGDRSQIIGTIMLGTVPELFGNPISPKYPFPYDSDSLTLIVLFFSVIAWRTKLRETWGWWLAIPVFCLFAFFHPLYLLAIKYLGFDLSRSNPLRSLILPLTVIMAFGVDALVKRAHGHALRRAVLTGTWVTLAVLAIDIAAGIHRDAPIRWAIVAGMLLITVLLLAQYRKTRPTLLMSALALTLVMTSYPLMLREDPGQIATASPLIDKIREDLPASSRYAVAAPGISVLPPNINATFSLASIHTYNSLSSTRYHTLIKSLGGKMLTYGRWNSMISPDYGGAMFWMSNIGLILSPRQLSDKNLEYEGRESGVYFYRVLSRMGSSLQVVPPQLDMSAKKLTLEHPRALTTHVPAEVLDEGDALEFGVNSGPPSVFILSQKFHCDWQARVFANDKWQPAQTSEINGVFQGVLLPAETQRVRLDFRPYVRYTWIAHVFWLLLLGMVCFRALRQRRRDALYEF